MKKLTRRVTRKLPIELILLIVGAALTRLIGLSRPLGVVWDEVYFKQFTASYFTHTWYFDIHPPLGKLLIGAWAWFVNVNPATINNGTDASLRFFVALFSVAIVPLTYGILYRLTKSRLAAGLAGLMVMLNGALIVQGRFVLTDSILYCFGLGAVYAIIRWREKQNNAWLIAASLLAGGAASVKWTGLTALLMVLGVFGFVCYKHVASWSKRIIKLAVILGIFCVVYVVSFYIQFQLLTNSSPLYDAYMSDKFNSSLVGDPRYSKSNHVSFWYKFYDDNKVMYLSNAGLTATDPYSSKWYTWPLETRPVYIWAGTIAPTTGDQGNIYLFSNPVTWWLTTAGVVIAAFVVVYPRTRRQYKKFVPVLSFLLLAYLVNWLPFAKIGRVMFLYHYLFASIYASMILAVLVAMLLPTAKDFKKSPRLIAAVVIIAITILGFFYFAPITYGWAISPSHLQQLDWLTTWR